MDKVINYLENIIKLKNGDTIVIGNSGGPDSMFLFTALLKLREKYNLKIICAHVNHNVRKESDSELEFLMDYCNKQNVPFESMKIEKYSDDNFESQARTIRYNFFEDLVKKYDAKYLMTAHHGDDLIETVLMRIVRGSTLKGYSGFDKVVDNGFYKTVRPLVFLTKDYIQKYDDDNKIPYVIDKTNFDDNHTRNRYRQVVLPFLKKEDKNVHEKFIKFNETLEEYDRFINQEIKKQINKVYYDDKIDIIKFKELDSLIQKKIITSILEEIYKEDLTIINDKHVKLIDDLIKSNRANATINLPHNVNVIKSYNFVKITKEVKEVIDYNVELSKFVKLPNGHTIEEVSDEESNNNFVARIDTSDVKLPLYVRTRQLGDKMYLKKVEGSTKLKDIFIDCKVPVLERDIWPVVVDSEGKIIWIPGVKKSKYTKLKNEKYDIIYKYI